MAPEVQNNDASATHHTVFVDTSLDTRLVMSVSNSDTVSDLKRKIILEHRRLFPAIGDIKIEYLKIKRRGVFYQLIDSLPVKSAFFASKKGWYVSADASRLEHSDGVRHLGKRKIGDQLALPWVTHSGSNERHDSHGSASARLKTAPFVSEKALNADQLTPGESCKDASKNVEEDKSFNDKHLDYETQQKMYIVNTDMNSKKRARDLHDESSPKDALEPGPSVKKKRKTQRVKKDVKAPDENIALTCVNDNANDKGDVVNNENFTGQESKGKDASNENNITNKGENRSALDQVAGVGTSVEGAGNENFADAAMIVENNRQQEKDNELVKKPAMENEIQSSLMSDQIDKYKDNSEVLLKPPEWKKGTVGGENNGEVKRRKSKRSLKQADNIAGDIPLTIAASVSKKGEDVIMNEVEVAVEKTKEIVMEEFTDTNDVTTVANKENLLARSETVINDGEILVTGKNTSEDAQGVLDNLEKQKNKMSDTTKTKKKKKTKKSSGRIKDESITKLGDGDMSFTALAPVIDERKVKDDVIAEEVKTSVENMVEISRKDVTDTNDVVGVTKEEKVLPQSETLMNNDAEMTTAKDTSQVNAQGISDNLEKQNEKMDDIAQKKKKRKTRKTADRKDGDVSLAVIDEKEMNKVSDRTPTDPKKDDDVIVKEVEKSIENMEEKSRKEFTDTNDVMTVSLMKNDAEPTTGNNLNQVNAQGILDNIQKQNEKMDEPMKKRRKKKTKKTGGINEDESITKHVESGDKLKEKNAQLCDEANKNNKFQDLPTKNQSTEVELKLKKNQRLDHHRLPEETTMKNVAVSEASKYNNEVNASEDGSRELDFRKYFTPDHKSKEIDMKKTKVDSRNASKDPSIANVDNTKNPKRTNKIDAQKAHKQSNLFQTPMNAAEKKSVSSSQQVKSLLNTPGTIFGDDSDDNASVNSDSSTRTPSTKPSSSSSSSSGENMASQRNRSFARIGKEGGYQSESEKISIAERFRRSSSFKKLKLSQVEDTESQPVDFVPESQFQG